MNNLIDTLVQTIRKNSPKILMGAGLTGIVVGTVLVGVESRKIDPIIEECQESVEEIHMAADTGVKPNPETSIGEAYTEKDKRRDLALTYGKAALKLGKTYLPSILVLSASVACIIGSHGIMDKRNAGLTVAYSSLAQAFSEYRKNVVEKYGKEADTEARYNVKAKKDKKTGDVTYETTEATREIDHTRFLDAGSKLYNKSANLNLVTVYNVEKKFKKLLQTRRAHIVTLNEVLSELDLAPSEDGQVLGWKWRPGVDPVDENGFASVQLIGIYRFTESGSRVLKEVSEMKRKGDPDPNNESVMLLDFLNLEQIV